MNKTVVISEESIKLKKEVERIKKNIKNVFKAIETFGTKEKINELFFKGDYDSYLLSEKEREFHDWVCEEYNPQIIVFMEISGKEKRISTLFFINALNEFLNRIKMWGV